MVAWQVQSGGRTFRWSWPRFPSTNALAYFSAAEGNKDLEPRYQDFVDETVPRHSPVEPTELRQDELRQAATTFDADVADGVVILERDERKFF